MWAVVRATHEKPKWAKALLAALVSLTVVCIQIFMLTQVASSQSRAYPCVTYDILPHACMHACSRRSAWKRCTPSQLAISRIACPMCD